ncbi:hypothetical protein [Lacticaseibacillus saniviri]|nr:hypothetical protein [Lacticaseibacillus saniviri]
MNQIVIIDKFYISRKNCPAGMTKIRVAGETIGLIETVKLLDDLPRLLNRSLTDAEQAEIINLAPRSLSMIA